MHFFRSLLSIHSLSCNGCSCSSPRIFGGALIGWDLRNLASVRVLFIEFLTQDLLLSWSCIFELSPELVCACASALLLSVFGRCSSVLGHLGSLVFVFEAPLIFNRLFPQLCPSVLGLYPDSNHCHWEFTIVGCIFCWWSYLDWGVFFRAQCIQQAGPSIWVLLLSSHQSPPFQYKIFCHL